MKLRAMSARGMKVLDCAGTCWGGEQECHWQEVYKARVTLEAVVTVPPVEATCRAVGHGHRSVLQPHSNCHSLQSEGVCISDLRHKGLGSSVSSAYFLLTFPLPETFFQLCVYQAVLAL